MEIKIFQAYSPKILETTINKFLKDSCSDVIDIEYQVHSTPSTRTSYGNIIYTALVTLVSVPEQSKTELKNKLVLIRNLHCYGIVGTPTGVFLNDVELCIGDVVKFEACDVYNEGIGIIAMFGNVIGIQGIASRPLSTVETITDIVKSHKVLESGETVWKGTGFTSCKLII